MIHPHLWPAVIGACVGLPTLIVAAYALYQAWPTLSQRKRWRYFVLLGAVELAYWLNVYAWLIEPNRLVVRPVTIESAAWHGAPITIAAIGDTHVAGPHVDVRRIERIVTRINAMRPDLVVLLGDYAAGSASANERSIAEQSEILNGVAAFAALEPRYGVVAVLGNHDSWFDRAQLTSALQDAGIAALWNRHVVIRRGEDSEFVVAGLADDDTGEPDYGRAIDGAPEGDDVIVLSHSPDPFVHVPQGIALMLAAHTHCGQVSVPLLGRPIVPSHYGQRFACHRIEEDGKIMYVTAGVGTSNLPVRFLNPPEIVLVTLRARSP